MSMLANAMHSAVAQSIRACGRTLPAARSLTATSAVSRGLRVCRTFLIVPSYKARVAVRAYATATATKKKPAATKSRNTTATAKGKAKARKPVAKKTLVKAKAKPKGKAKAKGAAAKKTKGAAKKPKKPVSRKPKKLTDEQKQRSLKRQLKATALISENPDKLPSNTWLVYVQERAKGQAMEKDGNNSLTEHIKRFAVDFKGINESERARLVKKVQENAAANEAAHKKWVQSHTAAEIHAANVARSALLRKFPKAVAKRNLYKITDERFPKRPLSSFILFASSQLTGSGSKVNDVLKGAGLTWKALPESEKKPFSDRAAAERVRYIKEMAAIGIATATAPIAA